MPDGNLNGGRVRRFGLSAVSEWINPRARMDRAPANAIIPHRER